MDLIVWTVSHISNFLTKVLLYVLHKRNHVLNIWTALVVLLTHLAHIKTLNVLPDKMIYD